MAVRVGIVDYAISNLTSVLNAFRYIGADADIIRAPDCLVDYTHLVLPGVGSFAAGMDNLEKAGFIQPILRMAKAGTPLIGMCLGMQLLAEEGEEFGPRKGLGLIPGRVVRMRLRDSSLRLPHIGWNELEQKGDSRLLSGIAKPAFFYFVHSYCYDDPAAGYVTGTSNYGGDQVALIEWRNIFGTQFHPEKSQKQGMALLRNFVNIDSDDRVSVD